jgi:hypothetical protein
MSKNSTNTGRSGGGGGGGGGFVSSQTPNESKEHSHQEESDSQQCLVTIPRLPHRVPPSRSGPRPRSRSTSQINISFQL